MILMIDNYDSFTYNIVQEFGMLGADVRVVKNDAIDCAGIAALRPAALVSKRRYYVMIILAQSHRILQVFTKSCGLFPFVRLQ